MPYRTNTTVPVRGEVAGSFLLGLVESFYHLRILPQGGVHLAESKIDPEQWYPYSMLIDCLRQIDHAVPSSRSIFFRAGINFLRIWYQQGPGKEMIHSGMDWLYANQEGGGYNSVVRGGSPEEIGWCRLLSMDEEAGMTVYENVTPLSPEYVRGVFYGGCMLFDDMEYVHVEIDTEPYEPHPQFSRILITIRFRLKSKAFGRALEERIENLQWGNALALTSAETQSLIWCYKGLQNQVALDAAYYKDINKVLADAVATTEVQRDEIANLSNHDALTTLPNLRLARDRLNMACDRATRNKRRTALLFIDLDNFKDINDACGHDAGDYVLKRVAERLCNCIRLVDTVARLGGDEFLVILDDVEDMDAVTPVAEKIIAALADPIPYDDNLLQARCSIGIALFPDHATNPEELLRNADQAMYTVKNSAKGHFATYVAT
ncbi:GGDEF domain-containing protein [Rhodanobacter sp. AS-Z3]|uniref:GGDEF domain-containing protein n=1 Tax=Rhodanobacter sp. AS-Z3 TaxID=3031330 RepID=UPI00247926C0|nr:GGDEF domain-containing protein [Rhodanobacter sp. AS-Z3]WEN15066.1 GGDEF domain-containing protein [Rhodanobacter sp. AS-Z3]